MMSRRNAPHRRVTPLITHACYKQLIQIQLELFDLTASKPTFGQIITDMTLFLASHYDHPGEVIHSSRPNGAAVVGVKKRGRPKKTVALVGEGASSDERVA